MALIYFFFIIKPLVGETLIEIESAVAKHKKVPFCFFQIILPATMGYLKTTAKGIFKNTF